MFLVKQFCLILVVGIGQAMYIISDPLFYFCLCGNVFSIANEWITGFITEPVTIGILLTTLNFVE